jgi:hypothetical protein
MLQEDLREFIALLNSHDVDYLIVGEHAVAFHGYPRSTGDIDFWTRRSPENAVRLMAVLREFGFGDTGQDSANLTRAQRVIQLGRPPNPFDFPASVGGLQTVCHPPVGRPER